MARIQSQRRQQWLTLTLWLPLVTIVCIVYCTQITWFDKSVAETTNEFCSKWKKKPISRHDNVAFFYRKNFCERRRTENEVRVESNATQIAIKTMKIFQRSQFHSPKRVRFLVALKLIIIIQFYYANSVNVYVSVRMHTTSVGIFWLVRQSHIRAVQFGRGSHAIEIETSPHSYLVHVAWSRTTTFNEYHIYHIVLSRLLACNFWHLYRSYIQSKLVRSYIVVVVRF